MKIVKANKNFLKEIGTLMKRELAKPPFNEKKSLKNIVKSLNFYMQIGKIYIVIIDKKIVGVIVFKKEQYWEGPVIIIEDLVVKQEFNSKGIGKNLIQYVESIAKKEKVKSINFKTHKKSKTIKFYNKRGYKKDKNALQMYKILK